MVSFTKAQKNKLKEILSKSKDKEAKEILDKINNQKRLKYVYDRKRIRELLTKAHQEKKKVKIKYYSPHSDEHTTRIIDIYQVYINSIIAFCHLRNDERTFAIERINATTMLNENFTIPKNWSPESIILNKRAEYGKCKRKTKMAYEKIEGNVFCNALLEMQKV